MTYEEAVEALKTHSPWVRMSEELIRALERSKAAQKRDEIELLFNECEEAPV